MNLDDIKARGLILIGCGKMGSAMLSGWLASGIPAASIWISDPQPSAVIPLPTAEGVFGIALIILLVEEIACSNCLSFIPAAIEINNVSLFL